MKLSGKRIFFLVLGAFVCFGAPLANSTQKIAISEKVSETDFAKYQKIFQNLERSNFGQVETLIAHLDNPILTPIIERQIFLKNPNPDFEKMRLWLVNNPYDARYEEVADIFKQNMPTHFHENIYTKAELVDSVNPVWPSNIRQNNGQTAREVQILSQVIKSFRQNDDEKVISLASNKSINGQIAWYAGLSAFRIGRFEIASDFFKLASNSLDLSEEELSASYFWLGRTLQKLGDNDGASLAFMKSANWQLGFYGQMALFKIGAWDRLPIPSIKDETQSAKEVFNKSQRVKAAFLLLELNQTELAENEIIFEAKQNPQNIFGLIYIARGFGLHDLEEKLIRISGKQITKAWPVIEDIAPIGGDFILDRALLFAVMRQESRFKTNAISSAGARGLMQLMPQTASWIANRSEYAANPRLLHNNALNVTLGESYLEQMMRTAPVSQSLVRTLIAYNAGPGNLNKWARNIDGDKDELLFIEALPVKETRDYVKNVMANLWIYHKRLGQNAPTLGKLANGRSPNYTPQDNPRKDGFSPQMAATN